MPEPTEGVPEYREVVNWYVTRRHYADPRYDDQSGIRYDYYHSLCSDFTIGYTAEQYAQRQLDQRKPIKDWDSIPLCRNCLKKAGRLGKSVDELAVEWLRGYHGSIDSTALLLAFRAGHKAGRAG